MGQVHLQQGEYINKFLLSRKLGENACSMAWEARGENNSQVVIKIFAPKVVLSSYTRGLFIDDFRLIQDIFHANIVNYKKVGLHFLKPYVVMEKCDFNLRKFINENKRSGNKLSEHELSVFLYQIASGLGAINERGIIHNDIKPENILIKNANKQSIYKISNFGISSTFRKALMKEVALSTDNYSGFSPYYAAPERWKGISREESDIYSLGIVLYELIYNKTPDSRFENMNNVLFSKNSYSEVMIKIVKACLSTQPKERPTPNELIMWTRFYLENGYWNVHSIKLKDLSLENRSDSISRSWIPDFSAKNQMNSSDGRPSWANNSRQQEFGNNKSGHRSSFKKPKLGKYKSPKTPSKIKLPSFLKKIRKPRIFSKMRIPNIGGRIKQRIPFLNTFRRYKGLGRMLKVAGTLAIAIIAINILFAVLTSTGSVGATRIMKRFFGMIILPVLKTKHVKTHKSSKVYTIIKPLVNNVSVVEDKNNKWGLINNKGKVIIPCKYDALTDFEYKDKPIDYAIYKLDGKCGFVSIKGIETSNIYDTCWYLNSNTGMTSTINKYDKEIKSPVIFKTVLNE